MKRIALVLMVSLLAGSAACVKKQPADTAGTKQPPPTLTSTPTPRPSPPATTTTTVPPAPPSIPPDPSLNVTSDPLLAADIEKINKESPFTPIFFAYDSDALDDVARSTMSANAEIMKKYRTWVITVEGHCDERGTAEYNLALGDRRALAVKNYMISLGITADRLKTVTYGSEFPFAPGHDEQAWKQNRRAHFMLTSK